MRTTLTVFAVLALLIATVALVGCPGQTPSDEGTPMTTEPAPGDAEGVPMGDSDEVPAEDSEPIAEKPGTIGQLMEQIDRPTSYEMTITSEKEDESATQMVLLEDDKPVMMKMTTPDGEIYINQEKREMFVYDPGENAAMKMPMDEDTEQDLEWKPGDYDQDAEMTGSETVDGVECWVFETESDGETVTSWISKDNGLPQKVEMGDEVLTFSYDRINDISKDEFELPGDAEIMDLGNMPGANQ